MKYIKTYKDIFGFFKKNKAKEYIETTDDIIERIKLTFDIDNLKYFTTVLGVYTDYKKSFIYKYVDGDPDKEVIEYIIDVPLILNYGVDKYYRLMLFIDRSDAEWSISQVETLYNFFDSQKNIGTINDGIEIVNTLWK